MTLIICPEGYIIKRFVGYSPEDISPKDYSQGITHRTTINQALYSPGGQFTGPLFTGGLLK